MRVGSSLRVDRGLDRSGLNGLRNDYSIGSNFGLISRRICSRGSSLINGRGELDRSGLLGLRYDSSIGRPGLIDASTPDGARRAGRRVPA